MNEYENLKDLLIANDKASVYNLCNELLDNGNSISTLYESYFTKILNEVGNKVITNKIEIWQEHAISSIISSFIASNYNRILDNKKPFNNKTILVTCPEDEQHDLGAMVVNDYLTLEGYQTTFLGANTPNEDILMAIASLKIDMLALSITTPYHLIKLKKLLKKVISIYPDLKIIIGGYGVSAGKFDFAHDNITYISDYESIKKIGEMI